MSGHPEANFEAASLRSASREFQRICDDLVRSASRDPRRTSEAVGATVYRVGAGLAYALAQDLEARHG